MKIVAFGIALLLPITVRAEPAGDEIIELAPGDIEEVSDGIGIMDVHYVLGLTALGSFATALAIGAASGNLGKLTDPAQCCPEGGRRLQPWRTTDRVLVNIGNVAYASAGLLALYHLLADEAPARESQPDGHGPHRLLAMLHGAAFVTSAVTGVIMAGAEERDSRAFAKAARIHLAANVLLVPLLSAAMANVVFD